MLVASMARNAGFGQFGGSPPAPQGYGPPGGVPPLGGPMTPGSRNDFDTALPLVLSIASTVLCCDPILGLPAIVLAIGARNAANMGAVEIARRRARTALVLSLASMGVGLTIELFEVVRYVIAALH